MKVTERSPKERQAYLDGFRAGLETAARRLETANDETSRLCLIEALRETKNHLEQVF